MNINIQKNGNCITAENENGVRKTVIDVGNNLKESIYILVDYLTTHNDTTYSGKIVCTEDNDNFKKGYIYTVKNGRAIIDKTLDTIPRFGNPCKTFEDMLQYGKFVELKGEMPL